VPETNASGEHELPEDVLALLRTRLETYEQIEVLQLLHSEPRGDWSPSRLSEHLHIDVPLVETAVNALQSGGLIQCSDPEAGRHSAYSPGHPTLKAAAERLLQEYRERPARIMQLISSYAIERVRTAAARAFADAFILKKGLDRG
jgi:DNA-binding MarR family transcriptional regulator